MSIKIVGLEKVLKNFDERSKATIATNIVNQGATIIEGTAKKLAPVDTGALRRSINTTPAKKSVQATATVGTSIEYGVYQEYGTIKQKAQPFMHPATLQSKSKIKALAMAEIQEAMKV